MTTEENNNPQSGNENPNENPSPDNNSSPTKKSLDIQRSLQEIDLERRERDNQQRFGYFSVPYPSTVGDQAYSQKQEYHHKIVDRKVITENRGIYVSGPKSGKGPDVYFPPPESTEKLMKQKEEDEKIRTEREKKKKEQEIIEKKKLKERNPFPFKPGGPQIQFSFYKKLNDEKPELPLAPEPKKKIYKTDNFKVITEKRNIQASALKTGNNPSDYFGFYYSDDNLVEKLKQLNEKEKTERMEKIKQSKNAQPKAVFKPASLKKCDPFVNDRETYELHNEQEIGELLNEYKEIKKKGNQRYVKPKDPLHDRPFAPARLKFEGRNGLFMYKNEEFYMNNDQRYSKEYLKEWKNIKKEENDKAIKQREKENEERKKKFLKPFTFNRLMKSSTFAPPISSYMINIKRDFPNIKFH
jgi:hypothetical protein